MKKLKTTIGLAAGIFNREGKLLLIKRTEHFSINGIDYAGNWELPVVALQKSNKAPVLYCLSRALVKDVKRKTGIEIGVDEIPAFYPLLYRDRKGRYDMAMITVIDKVVVVEPIKGQTKLVSTKELNDLAKEFRSATDAKRKNAQAKGFLGGVKGRQYLMALKVLEKGSINPEYREEASKTLAGISPN